MAELGLKAMRYLVLWERMGVARGLYHWSWTDVRLQRRRDLATRPVEGLLHDGACPAETDLLDPACADKFADFASAVARRYLVA